MAVLDTSPGVHHLRERAGLLSGHLPRLGQRIESGPLTRARPRWVRDEDFDPSWHVRLVGAPEASGLDGLLRMVDPLATEGFDRGRPLWQMTLVEGIDPSGGAALVIRLHHVCTDGVGALRLASVLFDLAPDAPAVAPLADATPDPTSGTLPFGPAAALWAPLRTAQRRLPGLVAAGRDAFTDPEPRAQVTVDLVRSVARMGAPNVRPLSPVMTGRSNASRLGAIDVDLDEAAASGRRAGGTINDVFVAGLLDGLRRYHGEHGHRPEALRIGVPINLRTDATADDVSNAFAPARITAPLQILDPAARIAAVHGLVLAERHQPAHQVMGPLAGLAARLPLARMAMGSALSAIDAITSNVPGPPVPLWLGAARVTALYPFGPRSGAALNVTLLSHERTARIGVHADPAAAPDSANLMASLRDGFAATLG